METPDAASIPPPRFDNPMTEEPASAAVQTIGQLNSAEPTADLLSATNNVAPSPVDKGDKLDNDPGAFFPRQLMPQLGQSTLNVVLDPQAESAPMHRRWTLPPYDIRTFE